MAYYIFAGIALIATYAGICFCGYARAMARQNNDQADASHWETLEHIFLVAFFVFFLTILLESQFDAKIYYLSEILEKLEAISHG